MSLVFMCVRRRDDPMVIVRPEGPNQRKFSVTLLGVESATFRFVSSASTNCATVYPPLKLWGVTDSCFKAFSQFFMNVKAPSDRCKTVTYKANTGTLNKHLSPGKCIDSSYFCGFVWSHRPLLTFWLEISTYCVKYRSPYFLQFNSVPW